MRLLPRLVAAIVLGLATPAAAQSRVDAALFLGGYSSLSSYEREFATEFRPRLEVSQGTALAVGGDVMAWLADSWGIGAQVLTAASDASFEHLLGFPDRIDGRVTIYGAHVLLRLPARSRLLTPYVLAGPTVIRRSGEAFQDFSGMTSVGGTFGIGASYRFAPRLSVRGDVLALIYRFHGENDTGERYLPSTQTDLLVRLGCAYRLVDRAAMPRK